MIVTAVEEFGISAVEAQAAGRPVIARAAGGALETVIDGETGRFWSGGPDALARAVLEFDDAAIDPAACRAQADRFSRERFRENMIDEVRAAVEQHRSTRRARRRRAARGRRRAGAVQMPAPLTPGAREAGLIERAVSRPAPLSRCDARSFVAVVAALLAGPTALAFFTGGYFAAARDWAGVATWVLAACALVARPARAEAGPQRP